MKQVFPNVTYQDYNEAFASQQLQQILKQFFNQNNINIDYDGFQTLLGQIIPAVERIVDKIQISKKLKKSTSNSSLKKQTISSRPQIQYDDDEELNISIQNMKISETQVLGKQELTYLILSYSLNFAFIQVELNSILLQGQNLREIIVFVSSDILESSISLEEFSFIIGSVSSTTHVPMYFKRFKQIIMGKSTQKKQKFTQFSRITFQEFYQIGNEYNLLQQLSDAINNPNQLIVSLTDPQCPTQISVKVTVIKNVKELLLQWKDLSLLIKTRLYHLNSFSGTAQRIINLLDSIVQVINLSEDRVWKHLYLQELTFVWIYQLLVKYVNNLLLDSEMDNLIPKQLLEFNEYLYQMDNSNSEVKASNFKYTPYYCEENIYLLARDLLSNVQFKKEISSIKVNYQPFAVLITNQLKQTYIRHQKAGKQQNSGLVVWDYHVILILKITEQQQLSEEKYRFCLFLARFSIKQYSKVFDFDSALGFQNDFESYFEKCIAFNKPFPTLFRVVAGETFVKNFASDRSHMIKKIVQDQIIYNQPPPDYQCLKGDGARSNMNLMNFINTEITEPTYYGNWMTEQELSKFFQKKAI